MAPPGGKTGSLPWREAGLTEREAAVHLLNRLTFGIGPGDLERVMEMGLQVLYRDTADPLLGEAGKESFEAGRLLSDSNRESYGRARGARYPETRFGASLR